MCSHSNERPFRGLDLTGKTCGRWTVLSFAGRGPHSAALWLCRCECGAERVVKAQSLKDGVSTSCGCLARELVGARRRTHGMFRSPEYVAWRNMKKRCLDAGYRRYADYGGRGIKVTDRWVDSFENFLADVGPRPSPRHSIHRVDNDGDYEPSNCVWTTRPVQDANKRTSRLVTHGGETLTVKEWSRRTGINHETLRHRLVIGWSPERALTTPPKPTGRDG